MLASEFEILLDRYEQDPATCSKLLRTHALADPKQFLAYASRALVQRPASRAIKWIAGLALSAGIVDEVLSLYRTSRQEAFALARNILASEPRFDILLLDHLKGQSAEAILQSGIDILIEISKDDRLVPGVLRLLKHPSAKVRSKAALFIGSRTQNEAWAANLGLESDARVRANILESLYGSNSEFVQEAFRRNVTDDNCRVAGNAALGLYLLGDVSSIAHIHRFVKHPEARFRNTGSWLMGRTGDPRFSATLAELVTDPDELVRRQALKALSEIRKRLREINGRPPLKAAIIGANGEERALVATVQDESGQFVSNILPTGFVLKTGAPARAIRNFKVEEHEAQNSFSVCFVLCLSPGYQEEHHKRFVEAVEACGCLRRSKDKWAIAKFILVPGQSSSNSSTAEYSSRLRSRYSILNVDGVNAPRSSRQTYYLEYSQAQDRIDIMLETKPFPESRNPDWDMNVYATESLVEANGAWGLPHWIIVGASREQNLIQHLSEIETTATVHVIAQTAAWQTCSARELTRKTGGVYRQIASAEELQQACTEVYSSLLHQYRISWEEDAERVELDIYSESGKGSAAVELLLQDLVSA